MTVAPEPAPREWALQVGPRALTLSVTEWAGPSQASPAPAASQPPVIVLHGYLEQGPAWDSVARRLGRRVLAPDHRGHGRSGHVGAGGWYHFWDYVGDLDQLVEHVGGPVDLVGHSMGGTIACLYAGSRPEQVRRLVLVEGIGPPDLSSDVVERARRYLADRRNPPVHKPMRDLQDAASRLRRSNPSLTEQEATALAERATVPSEPGAQELVWRWDPLHRATAPVPFQAALFVRFLQQIQAPVLLVDGGSSPWVLPDHAERVAALREVRRVIIEGAGHLVHHDAPAALAAAIREHLGQGALQR